MLTVTALPPQETPWKLTPIVELRYRYEKRDDRDFYGEINDNKKNDYYRWRFGVIGKTKDGKEFCIRYLGGIDEAYKAGVHSTVRNSDLDLAYFKFKDNGVTTTLGRQAIRLGEGRVVGSLFEFGNTARTFDGVRVQTKKWDAFAFRPGTCNPYSGGTKFAGLSLNTTAGASTVLFKHDSRMPNMTDVWAVDHLYKKKIRKFDYNVEATGESGRVLNKDLQAWALAANAGVQLGKAHYYVEGVMASGGSNSTKSYTFDQFYSTNQLPSGMLLLQGYRNINRLTVGVDSDLDSKTNLCASINSVGLHDASDYWYGGFGTPNMGPHGAYIDRTGASGTDVGQYVQLEVKYNATKHDQVWVGLGAFVPGHFIKSVNGGKTRNQTWGFAAYTFRF